MFKPLKTLPIALLAIGGTAEALTLGQIHVQSYINEPLKAVIDINKATEDEIKALKIKLADRNAFSKVGVDYTREVQGLRFAIVETQKGTSIHVTSQASISEPFLSFVVDADWNKGSVSKDYTVLLDPPIYTNRFAPPVAPADAGIVRSDEIPAPVAETETPPVPSEPSSPARETPAAPEPAVETAVASGDMKSTGPTAAGSNLWTIARENKPQAATIQQAMVAIHEANPDAFIRGNMNLMKQGQLLRVPPPEVIEAISQAAAETRISRHQQAWKSGEAVASGERLTPDVVATTSTGSAETAAAAADVTPSTGSADSQEGRLKLASAGNAASDATAGDGSAAEEEAGEASTGSLSDQLIEVREEMLSAQEENRELRERNSMLEEQLESQKKLIQLQNEQLARLQDYYRRLNEQGGDPSGLQKPEVTTPSGTDGSAVAEETADEAVSGTAEPEVVTEADEQTPAGTGPVDEAAPEQATDTAATAGEESTEEEAPAAEAADETGAPVAEEEPQQQEVPGETSFLASLMKNNTVVYGATATGIGILGLLALWLMRRRKATEEAEENIRAAELAHREPPAPEKPAAPLAAIDVLDKVDPLMARDEFSEARKLLEDAIIEEPKRHELHLKMLDVMHATGDLEGFEVYHAMLEAANFPASNPEAWTKVKQQHEDLQARWSGADKPEGDAAKAGATAAATGSAAVAAAALDQFAEIDETEDDLMPGVEDEEALEAIQKLNTSLDEVSFEDLEALPEEVKEESEGEETSADQEHSLTGDLGEQDDLESALKLFEMELEGRHPDATGIPDETKAELAETAELLETDTLDLDAEAEQQTDELVEDDDLDFASASEAFDNLQEEPVDKVEMETEEAGEKSTQVSEEEVQAKVELAEAFAEMGDVEGAREILNEVMREGTESQRLTAEEILQKYPS